VRAVDRELLAAHLGGDVIDLVEPVRALARLEAADAADEQPELELVADLHGAKAASEIRRLDQEAERSRSRDRAALAAAVARAALGGPVRHGVVHVPEARADVLTVGLDAELCRHGIGCGGRRRQHSEHARGERRALQGMDVHERHPFLEG
jgi:hypothetical protein